MARGGIVRVNGESVLGRMKRACAETGHGGNLELIELLNANGQDYCRSFHYSILEIPDPQDSGDHILRGRKPLEGSFSVSQVCYNLN
jgi:hypothetical protein